MLTLLVCNRQEPDLSSHLWILCRLLESRSDDLNNQLARLYKYILSMCCRKMHHRFQSASSQHYLQSLKQVKEFAFNPQPVGETSTNKTPRDSRLEGFEIYNDRRFLMAIVVILEDTNSDRTPISFKFPHIFQMAQDVASGSVEEPFELYTNTTCMEFHQLLLELLSYFQTIVLSLTTQSKKGSQTFNKKAFKQDLNKGRGYGYALMRMARGRAFRMHMENIEHLLSDYTPDTEASVPEGEREGKGELEDEEFEAIKIDKNRSLSESYGAWLRLMVVHFDAIEILVSFVNEAGLSYETISIKILVPPTTSPDVLPWSELFTNPNLFPTFDVLNPNMITKSNAEIKRFLDEAIENARYTLESYMCAKKAQDSWTSGNFVGAREALLILTKISPSPTTPLQPETDVSPEMLRSLVNQFIFLQKKNKYPANTNRREENLKQWRAIDEQMEKLCAIYCKPSAMDMFYLGFDNENFSGTLHCEAYLASLLDNFTQYFEIDSTYVEKQTLEGMKVDPLSHFFVIRFSLCCVYRVMDE
jgi:hypothetical protein